MKTPVPEFFLTLIWMMVVVVVVGDGVGVICWFSLNNPDVLFKTFAPNLVFPTCPNLQILGKNFRFPDFWSIPYKKNCLNSSTSDHIDMKLGAVTKLDKRGKAMSRKFEDDAMSENCGLIAIFPIYDHLEQSGSRIPDVGSAKLIFLSTVTFYLTKTENRTEKSLTQLSHYCFE